MEGSYYRVVGRKAGKYSKVVFESNIWYEAVDEAKELANKGELKGIMVQWSAIVPVTIWSESKVVDYIEHGYLNPHDVNLVEVLYWNETSKMFVNSKGEKREPKSWEGKE